LVVTILPSFFKAQEPIDKFDGYRIFIENKYGNTIEGVYIWQVDDKMNAVKKRSWPIAVLLA